VVIPQSRNLPLSQGNDMLDTLKLKRWCDAIDLAIQKRAVLHLWSHFHDFRQERDFECMGKFLAYVARKRDQGQLAIARMIDVASMIQDSNKLKGHFHG